MSACSDIAPLPTSFLIRSRSRHPRRWGILLETNDGTVLRMRAIGQNEMRQLLSTLMVHCLKAPSMEARHAPARSYIAPRQNARLPLSVRARYQERKPEFETTTTLVKTGWLFKKSEKKAGVVHAGKAWQRRWFVLEVATSEGQEEGTIVKTATLTYYHSNKDMKEGVEIPLKARPALAPAREGPGSARLLASTVAMLGRHQPQLTRAFSHRRRWA